MATDRSTKNRITATIIENRRRATRKVCRIGIPLVIIASGFFPAVIPVWVLGWLICFKASRCSASVVSLTGAAGEERALAKLLCLPAEYTLFNQIRLPDERSSTGFREADFVIVGPNGVYIVENKDFKGWIIGDECSRHWDIHKVGRGGTAYVKSGRNPIRQVQIYVSILAGIFRTRGINAWITPLVSLSRNNSLELITSEKVQVIRVADLCENILSHHGTLSKENMDKVIGILEELRAEPADEIVSDMGISWWGALKGHLAKRKSSDV